MCKQFESVLCLGVVVTPAVPNGGVVILLIKVGVTGGACGITEGS